MTGFDKFKYALEKSSIVSITDKKGIINFVSDRFCEISKYSKNELIGQPLSILQSPNHSSEFHKKIANSLSKGEIWKGDVQQTAKDGTLYWVSKTIIPILNEKSELEEVFTIHVDITEQKHKEESFKRFREVLSQTTDSILISDAETGKFIDVNDTACLSLGYTREELLNMSVHEIEVDFPVHTPLEWEEHVHSIKRATRERNVLMINGTQRRKDNTTFPVEVSIRYASFEGKGYLIAVSRDISKRLELEEMLENQNKRFQALIENLDDSIFLLNERGRTMYVSSSCYKQFGYSEEDLMGKIFSRIIHKDDIPFIRKIFSQVTTTRNKVFKTTCRILNKNKTESWIEIKAKNLLRDPAIQAIVVNTHNVTNQTLAEERIILALEKEQKLNEALADSEQKLKQTLELMQETQEQLSLLVEQSPIGIQIFDTTGYPVSMNKALESMTGLSAEEMSNYCILKDKQLFRLEVISYIQKAFKGEAVEIPDIKYRFKLKNNKHRDIWLRTFAYSIKNLEGEVTSVVLLYEDITEQRKAEEKLMSTYKALEEAQEFAKLGSWYIDLKTEKIEWSKQVFVSFGLSPNGYAPESLKEFRKFIHPQDKKKLKEVIQDTILQKKDYTLELRQMQPDGSFKWVLTKGKPITDEKGNVVAISGINFDIHERRLYEEKLREALKKEQVLNTELAKREEELQQTNLNLSKSNEELRKINAELDRFVYSASHDLRAPISSVLGLISVCKLTTDPKQIGFYLDLQEKSIKKLDKFIQDILDYSRNARTDVKCEEIQFRQMLESIFDQHTYMENSEKIQKVIHIHQKAKFHSDQNRLTIIFNNLISNAIRYSNVYQDNPTIEVNIYIQKQKAKIEVIDNGQGIGDGHLMRVFEMFYRATEKQSGSGLGLYIVKETIEKLGGTVQIESTVGKGTTVSFVLPNLQAT